MTLIIDTHENDIIKLFEASEMKFKTKQLNIGDFWLENKSKTLLIIIERKTYSDLKSSLADKRYNDQHIRINKFMEDNKNSGRKIITYYLIEGKNKNIISENLLNGIIISLTIKYHFFPIFTESKKKTVSFIIYLMNKLLKNTFINEINGGNINKLKNIPIIIKAKKEYMTKLAFMKNTLSLIPNIGEKMTILLMKEFYTINDIIGFVSDNNDKIINVKLLEIGIKNKKARESIIKFLRP